jgi:two-component system, chemotaxis family, CheB/CheR fusion protein
MGGASTQLSPIWELADEAFRDQRSLEGFAKQFYSRVAVLGRVQSLVAGTDAPELELHELVETEVRAHELVGDQRIVIDGQRVVLNEKAGETLALALHELATNAVKYGALSNATAKLEVRWRTDTGPLALEWRESGVIAGLRNLAACYGRELIEAVWPGS